MRRVCFGLNLFIKAVEIFLAYCRSRTFTEVVEAIGALCELCRLPSSRFIVEFPGFVDG